MAGDENIPQLKFAAIETRSLSIGKWANLLMAVAGIVAAYASRSDALLVDGLYSGVNFVSAMTNKSNGPNLFVSFTA